MIPALLLAAALATPGAPRATCYNLGQGGSDTAYYPVSDHTILVSAGIHAYRITTEPNPALAVPSTNLIVRGSGIVCSPLDIQLFAAGPGVGRTGLIVQSITPLSREEAERLRHGMPKASVLRR